MATSRVTLLVMKRADYAEAADMIRRVLAAVDAGDLTLDGPQAFWLVRHMEGAAAAFDVASGRIPKVPDDERA
jgi:hypothetical protein